MSKHALAYIPLYTFGVLWYLHFFDPHQIVRTIKWTIHLFYFLKYLSLTNKWEANLKIEICEDFTIVLVNVLFILHVKRTLIFEIISEFSLLTKNIDSVLSSSWPKFKVISMSTPRDSNLPSSLINVLFPQCSHFYLSRRKK